MAFSTGYTGTVYMLGATPEDIRSSFNERWKNSDEAAMQDILLQHMHTLITRTMSFDLETNLRKVTTWSEKVDVLMRAVRPKVSHSSQYIRGAIDGIYSRIKQFQNYNIQPQKLRSKVVLLQAKPYKSSIQTLKRFSEQVPALNNLKASLPFAHKDLSCPNIINGYLDPDILHEYENSNHCEKAVVPMEDIVKLTVAE